jgi:methionyl-tRNA synthetase
MSELSFDVNCPHCKKSLMDPYRLLNNKPSIRLAIKIGNNEGLVRLCSIYGCYDYFTDLEITDGVVSEFSCPDCKKALTSAEVCDICQAPMTDMKLDIGGKVTICSRSGCKNHSVGFVDLSSALNSFYHKHSYGEQK